MEELKDNPTKKLESDKIKDILFGQLELLAKANKSEMIEPEQVEKNVLAMVEIAKLFNL